MAKHTARFDSSLFILLLLFFSICHSTLLPQNSNSKEMERRVSAGFLQLVECSRPCSGDVRKPQIQLRVLRVLFAMGRRAPNQRQDDPCLAPWTVGSAMLSGTGTRLNRRGTHLPSLLKHLGSSGYFDWYPPSACRSSTNTKSNSTTRKRNTSLTRPRRRKKSNLLVFPPTSILRREATQPANNPQSNRNHNN